MIAGCGGLMNSQTAIHRQQPPHVLGSWTEILTLLRKDVRTVQQWARRLGLPVHRSGGMVWAYPAEMDAWYQKQRAEEVCNTPRLATQARLAESRDMLQSMLARAYFLS